eukprot:51981-Eustigmatos_ZCMA.PRE.1
MLSLSVISHVRWAADELTWSHVDIGGGQMEPLSSATGAVSGDDRRVVVPRRGSTCLWGHDSAGYDGVHVHSSFLDQSVTARIQHLHSRAQHGGASTAWMYEHLDSSKQ